MGDSFLDDLPDLGLGEPPDRAKKKRPQVQLEPGEVFEPPPVRCPFCNCDDTRVTKTLATVPIRRYRTCRGCGKNFKTVQFEQGRR